MADNKKYYWLKLKRDFFKRHDIQIIESMPNGKDYILFYLKLLCESVDHDGNLRFNEEIPYNEQMLSTITNTNVDVVRSAIKVFTQLSMMELMDDGTYFMSEVSKMLGSETYWAQKKREQREKQLPAPNDIGHCPTCPTKSKRKEKEKETDKELKKKSKKESTLTLFDKLRLSYELTEVLTDKIRDWLTYKIERKEEYTEQGLKALLSRISKNYSEYGETALIELIDESMSNNWKGIIFDRLQAKPKQGSFDTESFFNAAVSKSLGGRAVLEREAVERMENKHVETAETNEYLRKKAEELKNKGIGVAQ